MSDTMSQANFDFSMVAEPGAAEAIVITSDDPPPAMMAVHPPGIISAVYEIMSSPESADTPRVSRRRTATEMAPTASRGPGQRKL